MGRLAQSLILLLVMGLCFGAGWTLRGWSDGTTTTTGKADAEAQEAVTVGSGAAVMIDRAKSNTNAAVERVKEVRVPIAECPPGQGGMTVEMDRDVRESLAW